MPSVPVAHTSSNIPKVERDIVVVVVELEVELEKERMLSELEVDKIEESTGKGDSLEQVAAGLEEVQDYTKRMVVMVFVVVDTAAVYSLSFHPKDLADRPFLDQLQHSVVYSVSASK